MLPPTSISLLLLAFDTRRSFLSTTCTSLLVPPITQIIAPPPAIAQEVAQDENTSSDLYLARPMGPSKDGSNEVTRPSAPTEYLLPAARVGVYIYQALAVTEDLVRVKSILSAKASTGDGDVNKAQSAIQTLDNLFTSTPNFIRPDDPAVSRRSPYNLPPVVGELAAANQKQKERQQRSVDVGFAPQFFEVGELIGERRAWDRIVKAETARENDSEVRRAFNIYTTNLNFNPEKYVYSGSKEEKRKMIRDEKLPTAVDVIRSDLDARDLYRNAVQTALEDAKAEYLYQKKESGGDVDKFDVSELVLLLKGCKTSVDKWFSFIPDDDIREALEVVRKGESI